MNIFKKKLVAIIRHEVYWSDKKYTSYMSYHLYERWGTRSFKAIGFPYPHTIRQTQIYVYIIAPWLDGENLDILKAENKELLVCKSKPLLTH